MVSRARGVLLGTGKTAAVKTITASENNSALSLGCMPTVTVSTGVDDLCKRLRLTVLG